jgi:hypothetical protein
MTSPIKISKSVHDDAEIILKQTNVINFLENFGEVRIGGSYYTDLMYDYDIDLSVVSSDPRKSAIDFLELIISKKLFQKYQYGDFETFPRENRRKSHIIVLIIPFNGKKWEIEIWFEKEQNTKQVVLEEKLKALPQNIKEEIIKRKIKRGKSGLDKHSLSSYEIYQDYILE